MLEKTAGAGNAGARIRRHAVEACVLISPEIGSTVGDAIRGDTKAISPLIARVTMYSLVLRLNFLVILYIQNLF